MFRGKPVIGIAGGIGAGKSTVARILAELGCVVTESDVDGRAALRDPQIRDRLVRWWGRDVLNVDGEVDRAAVARIVFRDAEQRRRLEALTHPWIENRRMAQWHAAPAGVRALVIDAPLLFEAGLDRICDAIIFVQSSRKQRLERVSAHRDWEHAELSRREESQMPLDQKRARADYTVENDGDLDVLRDRVRRTLSDIVEFPRSCTNRKAPDQPEGPPSGESPRPSDSRDP